MTRAPGYNALMHQICVDYGYCGGLDEDGNFSHVDHYIPETGPVTAAQFTEWVFLADAMKDEMDLPQW
jgi:hypothetical protein